MKLKYALSRYWDNIRFWFNPRQKWLIKKIPNHWVDKDTLWELCILEGIKHYVEQDGGLGFEPGDYESSQADPEYPEQQKVFDREVRQAYEDIVRYIPALERLKEASWKVVPHMSLKELNDTNRKSYDELYGQVDKLEKEIFDKKTEIMIWAIKNRASIWT